MARHLNRWLVAFLKLFFDLLYHQFAWTYDLVSWTVSLGLWNGWIRTIIPDLHGEKILELGHGPGHLQKAIAAQGRLFYGLDRSPQMGRLAKRRLNRNQLPYHLVNGDGFYLPFASGSLDQVAATFPTEYIANKKTVKEIHRVLKPQGEFIFLPVAWITGKSILQRFARWLFEVTGQAEQPDSQLFLQATETYRKLGFEINQEMREYPNSKVLVIKAKKTK